MPVFSPLRQKNFRVSFPKLTDFMSAFALVFMALVSVKPAQASLASAIDFTAPEEDFHNWYAWTLGYHFYTWEAFSVPSLGFYDANQDGFLENHAVGLWDESGNLLAQTTITNESPLDGWFRWQGIAPVNLAADQWYVIAGFTELDDYTWDPLGITFDPRVYFDVARYSLDTELSFPEQNAWELYGFFGPNFQLAAVQNPPAPVPTPDGLSLLVAAGLALLLLCHRRLTHGTKIGAAMLAVLGLQMPTAAALEATAQVIQGEDGEDIWSPLDDRYERYLHSKTGAIISYDKVFDSAGNYIIEPGERLRWEWKRNGFLLATTEVEYLGGEDHCWRVASGGKRCGNIGMWWSMLPFRCQPVDDNYQLIAYRNGQQKANVTFATGPFRMYTDKTMWQYPTELKPKSHNDPTAAVPKGKAGETGLLSFSVTDDLGCGTSFANAVVEIETFPLPGTNDHDHFKDYDPGTGAFKARPGHPATIVNTFGYAKGVTDAAGRFEIDYQAQDFALDEKALVYVTKFAVGDEDSEQVISDEIGWRIRWADFLPNPTDIPMGFGASCKREHRENGATYLRSDVWTALAKGEKAFWLSTNERLSLNDGSFPWGGAVDTVYAACKNHASHRIGIDIDINSKTASGKNMLYEQLEMVWVEHPVLGWIETGRFMVDELTIKMGKSGFSKVKEEPIHYRYMH